MCPADDSVDVTATHAFITFTFRFESLSLHTWTLLGEASSKIEHVSGVPLMPETSSELYSVFLTKGVHGTTAIEGNTLSEVEVANRLEGRLPLPESQEYLGREVDNIVKAYNWIIDQISGGAHPVLTPGDLKKLNADVLDGLDVEEGVVPGEFRGHSVTVGDYLSPDPRLTAALLDDLCAWMNDEVWERDFGSAFVMPVLKAILAHLYIAWIHPFGDGNGRTARLVEFDVLARAGVPPISAHLLADHYNRTRTQYYRALSKARSDPAAFVQYAITGLVDGLRAQLHRIWWYQMRVAWESLVYKEFDSQPHGEPARRRRRLAIELADHREGVAPSEVSSLSPKLAAAYANKEARVLARDLTRLTELKLVTVGDDRIRASLEHLRAFLPLRNPDAARKPSSWPVDQL